MNFVNLLCYTFILDLYLCHSSLFDISGLSNINSRNSNYFVSFCITSYYHLNASPRCQHHTHTYFVGTHTYSISPYHAPRRLCYRPNMRLPSAKSTPIMMDWSAELTSRRRSFHSASNPPPSCTSGW